MFKEKVLMMLKKMSNHEDYTNELRDVVREYLSDYFEYGLLYEINEIASVNGCNLYPNDYIEILTIASNELNGVDFKRLL